MIPFISKILRIPDRFVGPKIGIGRRVSDNGHAVAPLRPVGIKDFLALEIQPRGMLLSPVLPEKSLTMLYSPRGIGKSWLGLSIGVTVASGGSLLKWEAPAPRRVLIADGEMPWPTFRRD
jgi:putative DNA primase/helicase